jgi:cell pole-organizing protein PopZ
MPRDGRTLEDVTRELLRPLLKQWLDDHLPRIVQETVQAEVERISRGSRG